MLFANDRNKKRVYILDIKEDEDYFCPSCNSKLILRRGEIKIHHFAHQKNSICSDNWNYDMTEWHYSWQNRFPRECQEIVKSYNGEKSFILS